LSAGAPMTPKLPIRGVGCVFHCGGLVTGWPTICLRLQLGLQLLAKMQPAVQLPRQAANFICCKRAPPSSDLL